VAWDIDDRPLETAIVRGVIITSCGISSRDAGESRPCGEESLSAKKNYSTSATVCQRCGRTPQTIGKGRRAMSRSRLTVLVLVVVLMLTLALTGCPKKESPSTTTPPLPQAKA